MLGKRASHRRIYPNCWDVIGGKVESGESITDALCRELDEELGITPIDFEYIDTVRDVVVAAGGTLTYEMFLLRQWEGVPIIRDDEHTRIDWFSTDEACALEDLAVDAYRDLFRRLAERILGQSLRISSKNVN